MRVLPAVLLGLAMCGTVSPAAHADTYRDLLNQFNEIVFGNVVSGSETEGRAVIGGNLTQSGSANYCFQTSDGSGPCGNSSLPATTPQVGSITVGAATQSFGALTGYGNVSGSGVTASKGNIFIGGTNTGALSLTTNTQTAYVATQGTSSAVGGNGNLVYSAKSVGVTPASQNGTVSQGTFAMPSFATTFQTPLQALSSYLGSMTGIAQGTSNAFNATPTTISGTAVTVYNVLGSNLPTVIQNIGFNLNGAQTVVINVTGAVGALPTNLNTFAGQDQVIWNFVGQGSLTLPSWAGTILATSSALTMNGISQGDIVAASLTQGANEIHNYAFSGNLSFVPVTTGGSSLPTPEPRGIAIMALAIVALGAVRGRFRRQG
ncbi:MAG: collagen-binding domain-containing protein [Rhodospirillales bacterium]